jgi:predicted GTPase
MATFWPDWRSDASAIQAEYEKEIEQLRRKAPIPSIWLFGTTGSGKSSIIRYLTGAESATIGEGYRPETKTSRRFDFPDSVEPLLSFIDTRGLGEAAYDPQVDIARFESSTQLMLVAVRVTDHSLHSVIEPLRRIRKASPHRPVVLVLTCLHEAMGSRDLTSGPDPFATHPKSQSESQSPEIPEGLQTLIDEKTKQFKGLYDVFVPIDLTQKEDGFADSDFGGLRLKQSILQYLPHAYRQALLTLNQIDRCESVRKKRARWQVLASSALAATAGSDDSAARLHNARAAERSPCSW